MTESQQPLAGSMQRRGAKAFILAISVGQVCALVRYVVLARMLGPHELGWAVMIVLVGQFFDSVTDSGSDRFLIQHRRGGEPEAQWLVQLVALGRGTTIAVLLLALAGPIARFLQAPNIEVGLRLLALAPFLSGFIHLDLRRVQRDHDFRIEGRATLFAEVLSLAATVVGAVVTHSHVAIVMGLIMRALTLVVVSHLMAVRRFAVRYAPEFGAAFLLFGLPLMMNCILLFFGSQGDRVIIGRLLGPGELGRYSAAMLLIFYPIQVLQRYISSLYLPQLVQTNPDRSTRASELGGAVTLIGGLATVGFAIVAPFALPILFGKDFAQSVVIVALIGALNVARFVKLWPTNMLLSEGRSRGVLLTNVIRLISFPLAIVGSLIEPSLNTVLLAFLFGELISIVTGVFLAARPLGLNRRLTAERIFAFVVASAAAAAWGLAVQSNEPAWIALAGTLVIAFAGLLWWRENAGALALLRAVFPHARLWGRPA